MEKTRIPVSVGLGLHAAEAGCEVQRNWLVMVGSYLGSPYLSPFAAFAADSAVEAAAISRCPLP
jgi:hypothetical protein